MKKVVFFFFYFLCLGLSAQNNGMRVGVAFNFKELFYQTYGLNGVLMDRNKMYQGIIGLNYTNASSNVDQNRNILYFDPIAMEKNEDNIKGLGFEIGIRKRQNQNVDLFNFYTGLMFRHKSLDVSFTDYRYIKKDQFYYFGPERLKEKLTFNSLDAELIFQTNTRLFAEFTIGASYRFSYISKGLAEFRDYNINIFDYGYYGFAPSFNFRVGYFLNK